MEILESPLALNISQRVAADDRIRMVLSQSALNDCGLTNMQLNFTIVAWNVDRLVLILLLPTTDCAC